MKKLSKYTLLLNLVFAQSAQIVFADNRPASTQPGVQDAALVADTNARTNNDSEQSTVLADAAAQAPAANPVPLPELNVPSAQQKARFDVWEYRVTGNTLLPITTIERVLEAYLGTQKTIDDLDAASKALTKAYKDTGYPAVIVNIPEQTVDKGIVILEVVESKISRLRVTGSKYHSLSKIKEHVPALTRGNVLHVPDVQKQLEAINVASPDRAISPILRPGRAPGTVEVELVVKDELPLHGDVEVNNRNTADTSKTRLSASVRYDNLFQKQHSLSLQYQVSPEDENEVQVFAATYLLPISYPSDRLVFYFIDTSSDVTTIGGLNVIGNGQIYGTRYIKPLPRQDGYFHSFSLGLDYKDFKDTQLDDVFAISYPVLSLGYDGSLSGRKSVFQFNFGASLGLPINTDQAEFTAKRFRSKDNFLYFTAGSSYRYTFKNDMQLRLKADAQLATSALISNEQFGVGGAETVRGYYESQVLDDNGLFVSLEWLSPKFFKSAKSVNDFRTILFLDGAATQTRDALPQQPRTTDIAGIGSGLRMRFYNALSAELDVAWALKDEGEIKEGDIRVHARFAYEF